MFFISVTGSKGNRWSLITIRMGKCSLLKCCHTFHSYVLQVSLAVYTRSPAAYEALSSFHLLQLPCARTLKMYIHSNVEGAGEAEVQLVDEWRKYDARVASHNTSRKHNPPLCKGVLVFDEVKVAARLH